MVVVGHQHGWWGCGCGHCVVDAGGGVMVMVVLSKLVVVIEVGGSDVGYKHCCGIFTTLHKHKMHYSRVRSTLVPSVACQTTEGKYHSY